MESHFHMESSAVPLYFMYRNTYPY